MAIPMYSLQIIIPTLLELTDLPMQSLLIYYRLIAMSINSDI